MYAVYIICFVPSNFNTLRKVIIQFIYFKYLMLSFKAIKARIKKILILSYVSKLITIRFF